jgi:AcrR family transcriptional regulator
MPYYKSDKSELRKNEKRKLIFETAAKVFAQKGYHQTSVKDITETARISVGTFYLYFKNKEDLFEKLYDEMDHMIKKINRYAFDKTTKTPVERYVNVVVASLWTYQKYRDLAKILLIEAVGLNPRFEKKYSDIMIQSCNSMETTLSHFKDIGVVDVPDTKVAAIAHEGAIHHVITYWLRTDDLADLNSYTYSLLEFLLLALKMSYCQEEIEQSIKDMLLDLNNIADELMKFI